MTVRVRWKGRFARGKGILRDKKVVWRGRKKLRQLVRLRFAQRNHLEETVPSFFNSNHSLFQFLSEVTLRKTKSNLHFLSLETFLERLFIPVEIWLLLLATILVCFTEIWYFRASLYLMNRWICVVKTCKTKIFNFTSFTLKALTPIPKFLIIHTAFWLYQIITLWWTSYEKLALCAYLPYHKPLILSTRRGRWNFLLIWTVLRWRKEEKRYMFQKSLKFRRFVISVNDLSISKRIKTKETFWILRLKKNRSKNVNFEKFAMIFDRFAHLILKMLVKFEKLPLLFWITAISKPLNILSLSF